MKKEKIPDPYKMKRIKAPITPEQAKRAKIRITTHLDMEVLDMIRKLAQDSGGKYQSVLNQVLRDYFFDKKNGLVARVQKLEEAVFKKKAA
ncbi:MAG: hypothetical protein A2W61_08405 [Deltaproteobacteria bacterium RIFCSPLOWO2_01_44_7]|nr:MAG: hypothetical protein A2712_03540 [Deltaproteobacteria bacterium RIFCSPHIGHO2_01_FULL_43_49]OGQ16265.1 MAG: hypothetical protein A3D22_01510 [Deltaproteobacteria bacterium RIFCSPHIGHO2_02_FULL_44_53]OGQ29225.1 MAG: hypothetical protein A3D98_05295 [Deltaproteobacteria bacterium RIFCSPHIGHO2_12_FULL_44_21]OGQ32782.1 MAG: hypothetical protein A2979_09440 [Deltaproteobacteria bacterium RIFCSPLOWO2_01_FULL_45_74]OGQ41884.1 MAG: hypothetical protein A3I70_09225 [Deltaproteobacteria bacterium 